MVSVSGISVHFGARTLFSDVTFNIRSDDRIGLTGRNGAGKSTLLRILAGEMRPDSGHVALPRDHRVGYLPQQLPLHDRWSVYEEVASSLTELNDLEKMIDQLTRELEKRDDYESDDYLRVAARLADLTERYHLLEGGRKELLVTRTLTGLGFEAADLSRPTASFSGGWRMRIELAKVLLARPDLLLLDEPTNHLDIESIQWLEDYFRSFRGALVLVSHDRALLDHVTHRTLEIENGKVTDYPVPYSRYVEMKEERMAQQEAAYRNQQRWIEQTERFIERFRYKATKAVQVQSRIKQLEKLERIAPVERDDREVNLFFREVERSGDVVAELRGVGKAYGSKQVLENIDLTLQRGEKVALIGRNGEGKTTLARIIVGDLRDYSGTCRLGTKVSVGYYAQDEADRLDENKTVLETIDEVAVGSVRTRVRDLLGAFLFSGEEVEKKVAVLSGGERSRLALLRMLIRPVNFLVLDEPTNHLDMRTKNILKEALRDFGGTLLLVSHDRDFLDGLVETLYEVRDHRLHQHGGDIYRFLEKRRLEQLSDLEKETAGTSAASENNPAAPEENSDWEERKRLRNRKKSLEKKIARLEEEIHRLEEEKSSLEMQLADPAAYQGDLDRLGQAYGEVKKEIARKEEEWSGLVEELEKITGRG